MLEEILENGLRELNVPAAVLLDSGRITNILRRSTP
jgi:hypothetical protein